MWTVECGLWLGMTTPPLFGQVRLAAFFTVHFPPIWTLRLELGLRWLKLGWAKTALEHFERTLLSLMMLL